MSNRTKIVLTIILILIIILVISLVIKSAKKENEIENSNKENVFDMDSYLDEIDNANEDSEESEGNNIVENENKVNNEDSKNQIIGKEEQESNNNEESQIVLNKEEKAKQLAKEEWGIDVDSYNYNIIKKIDDNNYQVEVRSKTTTTQIVIYNVNVMTGEITEQ